MAKSKQEIFQNEIGEPASSDSYQERPLYDKAAYRTDFYLESQTGSQSQTGSPEMLIDT